MFIIVQIISAEYLLYQCCSLIIRLEPRSDSSINIFAKMNNQLATIVIRFGQIALVEYLSAQDFFKNCGIRNWEYFASIEPFQMEV